MTDWLRAALQKVTHRAPAVTAQVEAEEYQGFPVLETAELMKHLEQRKLLCATATDGAKTMRVEIQLYPDVRKRPYSFYAHYAVIQCKANQPYPYACYIDISTFRECDTPLRYTETYITLHCRIHSAVDNAEIIPDDEKVLIKQAIRNLRKCAKDDRL